jgi:hypothetical protein
LTHAYKSVTNTVPLSENLLFTGYTTRLRSSSGIKCLILSLRMKTNNMKCDAELGSLIAHTVTINTWMLKPNSGIWYTSCTSPCVWQKACSRWTLRKRVYCPAAFRMGTHWEVYVPLTGFSRISHRSSDGQSLLHSGTEKKENVISKGSSVTASPVANLTECLIPVPRI